MNIDFVVDESTLIKVEVDVIPRKGDRIRMDSGGALFRSTPSHYIVDDVMWVFLDFEPQCTTVIVSLLKLG